MNVGQYSHPDTLERYSFLWSEARLIVAASALLLGGVPVLRYFFVAPALFGLVGFVLTITWILSGAASGYLLWRWISYGKVLFGGKNTLDTAAFLVSAVSGINLGIVGLLGINIGMTILSNYSVFVLTALLYIGAAGYLLWRWNTSGQRLF